MVLVSLIIGLGLAELLSGIAQTIRNKEEVKLYWAHSVFVIVIFLALIQTWWEIWGVRETPAWTFLGLLMMLGGPIGLFLISHLVFPEQLAGANLKSFYYERMRPVFWLGVLTVVLSSTFRPMILGTELFALDNLSSFLLMAIFAGMASTRNAAFHSCMVVLVFVALLADILLVKMEMQ
jgi:hypothetical protein